MNSNKIYIEITPFFPTEQTFRGSYIYDQVQALERSGRFSEVRVLRPAGLFHKSYDMYNGIKVFYFPALESPSYLLNGILDQMNRWLFRYWWKRKGWKASEVIVAHAHVSTLAIYPLEIKKMNPSVITVVQHHDLDPYTIRNGRWADKKWNLFFRAARNVRVFSLMDYHVCVSEKVKDSLTVFPQARQGECYSSYLSQIEKLRNWKKKAFIKKAIVLYNGVDTEKFYVMPPKQHPFFSIGCIANFVELKGYDVLLEACRILIEERQIKDICITLIGSGPLLELCKSFVALHQMEKYVIFENEVQHYDLCHFYNSLDLFVLPSYFEGFGCVFTEAAACGVPFMTCENQGIEDYISEEERSRWLFPVKDSLRLADIIAQYIKHPTAQKLIYSFDINMLVANYLDKLGV